MHYMPPIRLRSTKLQRTQVYGNSWYKGDSVPKVAKAN